MVELRFEPKSFWWQGLGTLAVNNTFLGSKGSLLELEEDSEIIQLLIWQRKPRLKDVKSQVTSLAGGRAGTQSPLPPCPAKLLKVQRTQTGSYTVLPMCSLRISWPLSSPAWDFTLPSTVPAFWGLSESWHVVSYSYIVWEQYPPQGKLEVFCEEPMTLTPGWAGLMDELLRVEAPWSFLSEQNEIKCANQ